MEKAIMEFTEWLHGIQGGENIHRIYENGNITLFEYIELLHDLEMRQHGEMMRKEYAKQEVQ